MHDFRENQCRCCKKFFCCKKCRGNHENLEHGVFPDCDICLYGRAFLTNAPEKLLEHVKSAHWPLRCVFCKRYFGTTDELQKHIKCPVGLKIVDDTEKSPYTPGQSQNESLYDSPPLALLFPKGQQPNKNQTMFSNLATSTPMQRNDEKILFEQIQEAITPVDYSEMDNKESISKAKQNLDNASLKRKVTFCETPMAESYRKQKCNQKKRNYEKDNGSGTPCSGSGGSSIFYSVKEEQIENSEGNDEVRNTEQKIPASTTEELDKKQNENKENIDVKHEESTMWISASNLTSDISKENSELRTNASSNATPMASKQKKRQVNIVMPTPVPKTSEKSLTNDVAEMIKHEKTDNDIQIDQKSPTKTTPARSTETSYKTDEESNETSSNNTRENVSETSLNVQNRLWISMSRIIRNVTNAIQSVSSINEDAMRTFKRRSTDHESIDGPNVKRYKLTDIKCRPTIRKLPKTTTASWEIHESFRISYEQYRTKKYVDKATQTDDYLLLDFIKTN